MLEPFPPISKIFNLIVQKERQRSIGYDCHAESVACAASGNTSSANQGKPRTRPVCSHCGLLDHTVDRCYKLHGYPPGFQPKSKAQPIDTNDSWAANTNPQVSYGPKPRPNPAPEVQPSRRVGHVAAQVSSPASSSSQKHTTGAPVMVMHSPIPAQLLSHNQIQDIIAHLSAQLCSSPAESSPFDSGNQSTVEEPFISHVSGKFSVPSSRSPTSILNDNLSPNSMLNKNSWIMDTGVTHHICCNIFFFL